ncbi:MAG: 3-isopropylmalate dehydratase small subunit, partial [Flavobacteriaceae bacterium]|nr:3-isopropylmalate dehydratase small subunit [Flavobacteriaceae bacterium]
PITVPDVFLKKLLQTVTSYPDTLVTVNLLEQTLSYGNDSITFDINPYNKTCLINGYDDIDFLVSKKNEIIAFEKNRPAVEK